MQKVLISTLVIVGVALLGIVAMAVNQPDNMHVERSVTMTATIPDLAPFVEDMEKFVSWSPWNEKDPEMEKHFSAKKTGVGAWYAWDGNVDVGRGRQQIAAVEPGMVHHELEFYEPFASVADSTITYTSNGEIIGLTWSYDQEATFGMKVMSLFTPWDSVLGPDLERGLELLKPKVERAAMDRIDAEKMAAIKIEIGT